MAAVSFHPAHGVQKIADAPRELLVREVAEIERRYVTCQLQAEIRGRGPARYRCRFLLYVVRDKPVVFGPAQVPKVTPGSERDVAQEFHLARHLRHQLLRRRVHEARYTGRCQPNGCQGARKPWSRNAETCREQRDQDQASESIGACPIAAVAAARLRLSHALPFEKVSPREEAPYHGSEDGVRH